MIRVMKLNTKFLLKSSKPHLMAPHHQTLTNCLIIFIETYQIIHFKAILIIYLQPKHRDDYHVTGDNAILINFPFNLVSLLSSAVSGLKSSWFLFINPMDQVKISHLKLIDFKLFIAAVHSAREVCRCLLIILIVETSDPSWWSESNYCYTSPYTIFKLTHSQ